MENSLSIVTRLTGLNVDIDQYILENFPNDMNYEEFHGRLDKLLKKLVKVDVLVIDDFLLTSTNEQEQKYLMELFEMRSSRKVINFVFTNGFS